MKSKIVLMRIIRYIINILVTMLSISCIFPFFWITYSSFKTLKEFSIDIMSLPTSFKLDNYMGAVTKGTVQSAFLNSTMVSIIAVFFILLIGFITGYLLSRFDFTG
ncbi:MAG: carbohydrate ABC transporter permease, partial [Halanaerobiales bacterium]